MLISKKELLNETGISYGQLYRWKREGLIPEDWFIKQPSFTGQETFFPKSKILNRIKAIQELKDNYSLEELAKILSPEVSERNFTGDDLNIIEEIQKGLIPAFIKGFDKNNFTYLEVLIMIALSEFKKNNSISIQQITEIIEGIKGYLGSIKSTGFIFVLFDKDKDYYATIYGEQEQVFLDSRLRVVNKIHLDDISNPFKFKYRKSFNFKFDDGKEKQNTNFFNTGNAEGVFQ
jgi:DNA-binding transcriptional MerR regulator